MLYPYRIITLGNTNMSVVTVSLNMSAFCNVTLYTGVTVLGQTAALIFLISHLTCFPPSPTECGHPLNKIKIHAPTGSQTLICHSSNVAVCTMNYLYSFMLLYFISHACFCRFAHWVTVSAGMLDTAHYLKTNKIIFHRQDLLPSLISFPVPPEYGSRSSA